jgi:outer membrane protein assembly factor BamB
MSNSADTTPRAPFALLLTLGLLLSGCGTNLLGSPEEPPLEGERISVLQQDEIFNADPETAAITVALPAPVANADWPQAGGNGDHAMHHLALSEAPQIAWRSVVGTGGDAYQPLVSEPVSAGGRIFALDAASNLSAFDLATGDQLWRISLTPEGEDVLFGGGIATDGARVYATTNYGYVYAIDAASGAIAWTTRIDSPIRAAPGLAGDRLIVITLDNRGIAIATATGETIWTHSGPVATAGLLGSAAPAIGEGVAVVAYSSGEIFALDLATGEAKWSDAIGRDVFRQSPAEVSGITGRIVIDRGLVLVSGNSAITTAIDLASGERLWERPLPSATGPWVAGEFIYLVTASQTLLCMTRTGGKIKWFLDLPRFVNPTERTGPIDWYGPALAGDRLLLLSTTGELMTVSPYTGELLGTSTIGAGSLVPPIVIAGGVYLLLGDATLVALR